MRERDHWGDPGLDGRIILKWAGHVPRVCRGGVHTGFWWGNMRERDHWGDPGIDGRTVLRWMSVWVRKTN